MGRGFGPVPEKAPFIPLKRSALIILTLSVAFAAEGRAHHGQDFLLVQDYQVPSVWDGSVFSGFEWSKSGGTDELSVETGMMLGIAPRLSLGAAVHFADEGDGWNFSSVTPMLQFQLTPPSSDWPFKVSFMAGYVFAEPSDESYSTTVYEPYFLPGKSIPAATGTQISTTNVTLAPLPPVVRRPSRQAGPPVDPPDDTHCGPDYGPDAPPCPEKQPRSTKNVRHAGHGSGTPHPIPIKLPVQPDTPTASGPSNNGSAAGRSTAGKGRAASGQMAYRKRVVKVPADHAHTGIHRHGENGFQARLIVETDLTASDKLLFNLIHLTPESGKPAWGYAAGLRHSFSHEWAVGVEAIGDFGDANEHEMVLGGYFSPNHHATFKLGVGFGLTEVSPDFSLRTGFVIRF